MYPKTYYITASSDIIKNRAKFLEEKGFELYSENEYSIEYRSYERNILISIYFERYSDTDGGIGLDFTDGFPPRKCRKCFIIHSFDVVTRYHNNDFFDYRKIIKTKLDCVLKDLDFLEEHFEECMDLNYCEKMDRAYNFEGLCEKYLSKLGCEHIRLSVTTEKE